MKAITAVCATGASVPAVSNGRVSRQRDGENAEIQMYLSKLKDLVPFMPKHKKLSKLEVILHVIDYICDLQTALESHPAVNQFDAQAVLNGLQQQQQQQQQLNQQQLHQLQQQQQHHLQQQQQQLMIVNPPRQPLGLRPSPNTILSMPPVHSIINSNELTSSIHTTTEKNSSDRSSC